MGLIVAICKLKWEDGNMARKVIGKEVERNGVYFELKKDAF